MTRLRLTLTLLLATGLLSAAAVAAAAPSAGDLPAVTVTSGWGGRTVVSDATSTGRLAGEASRGAGSFTFTVDCGGAVCTGVDLTEISFDFGDGIERTGAATTVAYRYHAAGVYTVAVQIIGRDVGDTRDTRHTTRYVTVDVAAPSADLVDLADLAARDGLLRLHAADVLGGCTTAVNGVHAVGATRTGRALFCPDPAGVFASPPDGTPLGADTNATAGGTCLDRFYVCGLAAADFALGASPLSGCDATRCSPAGTSPTAATPSGIELLYAASRCGDGYTATRTGGGWTTGPGDAPGCLTRGEMYRALLELVDGAGAAGPVDTTITCVDAADYTTAERYPVLRAKTLGVPALRATDPDLTADQCAPDAPARRDEAYTAIAALLGVSGDPALTGLLDLADLHLGYSPESVAGVRTIPSPLPQPDAASIAGALEAGVPLPTDVACADGRTPCLNPDTPLTRGELARMVAAVTTG